MKSAILLTVMSMVFSLLSSRSSATGEEAFWTWFTSNETQLFSFEKNQDAIFDDLSAQMHRVNPNLTSEFGPVKNGKREFVISAAGIRDAFPAVEALYSTAPALPRWVWVKYRPPRLPINDLKYGGKSVRADDVRYLLVKDGDKVGVVLFFDGYQEKEKGTWSNWLPLS